MIRAWGARAMIGDVVVDHENEIPGQQLYEVAYGYDVDGVMCVDVVVTCWARGYDDARVIGDHDASVWDGIEYVSTRLVF